MAYSLITKDDLLKKVELPSENTELSSALNSGGDKAKWFYDPKKFDWPMKQQIVIKSSAGVISDLKRGYSARPRKSTSDSATYDIGRQSVKFEATGKTNDDVSAATMTRMQELGSAYIFKRAIEDNQEYKKPQDIMDDDDAMKELNRIWKTIGKLDEVDEEWIESFHKQQQALIREIGKPKFTEFNREGGFMQYITDKVKEFGISSKDNWDPADVWLIEDEDKARTLIDKVMSRGSGKATMSRLSEFNAIMRILFNTKKVFGVSLKKVAKGQPARIEFLNHSQKFLKSLDSIHMSYSYSKCGMGSKKDKRGNASS